MVKRHPYISWHDQEMMSKTPNCSFVMRCTFGLRSLSAISLELHGARQKANSLSGRLVYKESILNKLTLLFKQGITWWIRKHGTYSEIIISFLSPKDLKRGPSDRKIGNARGGLL